MFRGFVLAAVFALIFPGKFGDWSFVLRNMGFEPAEGELERALVAIPEEWDGVYETYNALQREGGFDLRPYKGKICTRHTYLLPEQGGRGNVLVYNGAVIGGDVCSVALDGFMLPLERDRVWRFGNEE